MSTVSARRVTAIRDLLKENQPRSVVFYGSSYRRYWQLIAGEDADFIEIGRFLHAKVEEINFYIINHPVARGTRNQDFVDLGSSIRSSL